MRLGYAGRWPRAWKVWAGRWRGEKKNNRRRRKMKRRRRRNVKKWDLRGCWKKEMEEKGIGREGGDGRRRVDGRGGAGRGWTWVGIRRRDDYDEEKMIFSEEAIEEEEENGSIWRAAGGWKQIWSEFDMTVWILLTNKQGDEKWAPKHQIVCPVELTVNHCDELLSVGYKNSCNTTHSLAETCLQHGMLSYYAIVVVFSYCQRQHLLQSWPFDTVYHLYFVGTLISWFEQNQQN